MTHMLPLRFLLLAALVSTAFGPGTATAQQPLRGSLVEDRAARKLIEAGDARLDANEASKAVDIWQSVIERYPRSRERYKAHMRLGNHFLKREKAQDKARPHFEEAASEENRDEDMRAEATMNMGVCFYEARNYGKCFKVMREVIEQFPVSQQVNNAYYYIGLGHFQLGHYSRAISALEKVGTAFSGEDGSSEKLEAGKRLFIKIEDADLAILGPDDTVQVRCRTSHGDEETVTCFPVGRNVRVVLGSVLSGLGKPQSDNGVLEIRGNDVVKVTYLDAQTADRKIDQPVLKDITIVGTAKAEITDGAFSEPLLGVVLGRGVNAQVTDADHDTSDAADTLKAVVSVYREKTKEEIELELAELQPVEGAQPEGEPKPTELEIDDETGQPKIDKFKLIDQTEVVLTEAKVVSQFSPTDIPNETPADEEAPAEAPADDKPATPAPGEEEDTSESETPADPAKPDEPAPAKAEPATPQPTQPVDDGSIHSGVFRGVVTIKKADEAIEGDEVLQALPGDVVRITYLDERHYGDGVRSVLANAQVIEGNLDGVRVTQTKISDQELRIKTQLKTASALTNIGNRYKEFGLKKNALGKYEQALDVCDEVYREARQLGGRLLEETYVQLWQIYFAMDRLELAAAMAQRLQREFPASGFVDDAVLQLADVARQSGDLRRAVGLYARLVSMKDSQLRGEAQFGVAECYELMARETDGPGSAQILDRAFQEYKKVFEQFPDSGRVGEAVAKMANYYYERQDYARAVDTFETVLSDHPDAKFLDVILFNYGRCLYRMKRPSEAARQFNQLISDFPESPLAEDAKRIAEALSRAQAATGG